MRPLCPPLFRGRPDGAAEEKAILGAVVLFSEILFVKTRCTNATGGAMVIILPRHQLVLGLHDTLSCLYANADLAFILIISVPIARFFVTWVVITPITIAGVAIPLAVLAVICSACLVFDIVFIKVVKA